MNWAKETAAGVGFLMFVVSSFVLAGQFAA